MQYKPTILEGESLKKYQNEILKMTEDIIELLDENGIDYSLSGGSVLGAVRHEGFIPWDDDIDLNILRRDYQKLIDIFSHHDKYYVQTPIQYPEIGILVTQIRKKGTVARRQFDWNVNPCGLSIDLYIVENTYDNKLFRIFHGLLSEGMSFIVSSVRTYKNRELPDEIEKLESRNIKYKTLKYIVGFICQCIPMSYWLKWTDKVNAMCKNESSKYVTNPTARKHFFGELLERNDLAKYRKQAFENHSWKIPYNYKKYLSKVYGEDYMLEPPVDKRERHAFLELDYGED